MLLTANVPAVATAAAAGGVTGEGAAGAPLASRPLVLEATATAGGVTGENNITDRQRPEVVKAATLVVEAGIASFDCTPEMDAVTFGSNRNTSSSR